MNALLAAVALVLVVSQPALASNPQEVANRVSQEVMSPFCPGLTLHDCPSEASLELRERVIEWAEAGWSYERIVAHLEDEYGQEVIRATPPRSGMGMVAWLLPGAVLALGAVAAYLFARRWNKGGEGGVPAETPEGLGQPEATPVERARLTAELERMRGPT